MLSGTKKASSDLSAEVKDESGCESSEKKQEGGGGPARPFMSRKGRRNIFSSPWTNLRASGLREDPCPPGSVLPVHPQPSPAPPVRPTRQLQEP